MEAQGMEGPTTGRAETVHLRTVSRETVHLATEGLVTARPEMEEEETEHLVPAHSRIRAWHRSRAIFPWNLQTPTRVSLVG